MYHTYALYNREKNKIYIGQTNDLENRLKRHNGELSAKRGSYTKINKGNWEIIYQEKFETRSGAIVREKELKSYKGRQFIRGLIMAR